MYAARSVPMLKVPLQVVVNENIYAYLRLLPFPLANLIPPSDSSNPTFLMMYSAFK